MFYTSKQVWCSSLMRDMYSPQNDPHFYLFIYFILFYFIFFFHSDIEVIPNQFKERNRCLLHCGIENTPFLDSLNDAAF